MPSLSYKDRFCLYVKEGSKTQTIRAFRSRPFKVGDQLFHFYGLRTKYVQRLLPNPTICTLIGTIYITEKGDLFVGPCVDQDRANYILGMLQSGIFPKEIAELSETDKNIFAWADGFRQNDDLTKDNSECWNIMFSWWKENHSLPFTGQIIHWKNP